MMEKVRYELDPHNRLIITKKGKRASPHRFRRVLDGYFSVDKENMLVYHIKTPLQSGTDTPHQIKLKGTWSLTDNYDLRFTLNKWKRQTFGDQLTLKGNIIDVDKNSLLFAVTTTSKDGIKSTRVLRLRGYWQADRWNRLGFKIRHLRGRTDELKFLGSWEINKNHNIIYRYQKVDLLRRHRRTHQLTFRGHWDITQKRRILYILEGGSESVFNFRTGIGVFTSRYIKYELGIGVNKRRNFSKRTLVLYGRWSLKKGVGLIFEVQYSDKKIHKILFGAKARIRRNNYIEFKLRGKSGRPLGATLELSRVHLKGEGKTFLRLLAEKGELQVLIGGAFRW